MLTNRSHFLQDNSFRRSLFSRLQRRVL